MAVRRERKNDLSEREAQLVQLAAEGHTDGSIAHELGISEATVNTYWSRVRIKVGPYSRPELISKIIHRELDGIISELQEENKHLHEELRRAAVRESLATEEGCNRHLVLQAPDAIVIVTPNGDLETVNAEAARLFGYERDEVEGQSLQILIPERYRGIHLEHRETHMASPERRKMAEHSMAVGLHKDGTEFAIAAALSPAETKAGFRVICIVRQVETHELDTNS